MIYSTIITDVEEKHGPPSMNLLDVAVIGEVASLSIVRVVSETNTQTTYETLSCVAVNVAELMSALGYRDVEES